MANNDTWVCPKCRAVYVEDNEIWEEPKRCPHCGTNLTDQAVEERPTGE